MTGKPPHLCIAHSTLKGLLATPTVENERIEDVWSVALEQDNGSPIAVESER